MSRPEPPITPTQRAYLALFDLHVAAESDAAKLITRSMMDGMLAPMCAEAGLPNLPNDAKKRIPMGARKRRDLISGLIAHHRACAAEKKVAA